MNENPLNMYAQDAFTYDVMKKEMSAELFNALMKTIQNGEELKISVADGVADAMMRFALKRNATHFTHWFQPMTGSTAQKHDAFLTPGEAIPMIAFCGKELIRGEADGSSFPSGGLRATFEARGYTTWDCTSPAFVADSTDGTRVLYIPTAFCSFSGEALDEKTPLLRSMDAISKASVRILKLLGVNDVKRVMPKVGAEQEYFLIDKSFFNKRKDLVYTGRTLFGAPPAKGQELYDQYYAATPERVSVFMRRLNEALWKIGVPAKTEHNEVAPSQYELAPLFDSANVAADHNQMVMELMQRIASSCGFACLLHEKPFSDVNGSGKHNNWSLMTDTGLNLLKQGKTESQNRIFLTFFVATIAAVDKYAKALRMSCASLGNQYRLGGHEAPPEIISVFIGKKLEDTLEELKHNSISVSCAEHEEMRMGVPAMAVLYRDDSDRNRTSPFAYSGNRFEFRMVGSSQSLGTPNTVLNTITADMLNEIYDKLSERGTENLASVLYEEYEAHKRVLFCGNNYGEEWAKEARRRGLPIIDNTVDAIELFCDEQVMEVFTRNNVLRETELRSRREVALTTYVTKAHIEASTMRKMTRQSILPACIRFCGEIGEAIKASEPYATQAQKELLKALCDGINASYELVESLSKAMELIDLQEPLYDRAVYTRDKLFPLMEALRERIDALELIVDKKHWPLPSYGEILFRLTED